MNYSNKESDKQQNDNLQNDNLQNDNLQNANLKNDNLQNANLKNDSLQNDNVSKDKLQNDNVVEDKLTKDSMTRDKLQTDQEKIPVFAIIGHPNEGKSSVVSTLAEDDSVRIGPIPGETIFCQSFPVTIDGKEIITFVDTPGFQNPRETLAWMQKYNGPDELLLHNFIKEHQNNPDFRDECELLTPVARGAGIIYVVDGSRPLRTSDRIEMEILRLTARPRMSIINCKEDDTAWLEQWKTEFRRHFNSIRIFNAHKATWAERIDLLESLKGVDQDWQPALNCVIDAFRNDWSARNTLTASMAVRMLEEIMSLSVTGTISGNQKFEDLKATLEERFRKEVEVLEKRTHYKIRKLYRHNIFNCELPENSILNEDLFSEKTWQFLGLSPRETALAAGAAGGAVGVVLDVAAAGLTFGVFSTIGGILGAGYAMLKGKQMAEISFKGVPLGRDKLQIGPLCNLNFMYILLDRLLIFHGSVINWAHARREVTENLFNEISEHLREGVTVKWSNSSKEVCQLFFKSICGKTKGNEKDNVKNLHNNREARQHKTSSITKPDNAQLRENMKNVILAALEGVPQ
ncbi:FusA1 (modular protein) [Desulfamplus magnetovallimortis]|uniref:FusA1 (Modular protein) n=1 Tax=Desulfamplus magnetovallimortis TaxID=1246637 RepID=A0A1W1H7W8_9BACT|nr:GTPase/DUF3482 domain-containing protein [Desulfamplus magnetovallimortis]SLM28571.1 FusA1 (modular protein) [Desulfamplus magnetovallimortis]